MVEPAFAERDDAVGEDLRVGGRPVAVRRLAFDDLAHGGDEAGADAPVGRGHEAEAVLAFVGEEGAQRVVVRESAQEVPGEALDVLDARLLGLLVEEAQDLLQLGP